MIAGEPNLGIETNNYQTLDYDSKVNNANLLDEKQLIETIEAELDSKDQTLVSKSAASGTENKISADNSVKRHKDSHYNS